MKQHVFLLPSTSDPEVTLDKPGPSLVLRKMPLLVAQSGITAKGPQLVWIKQAHNGAEFGLRTF